MRRIAVCLAAVLLLGSGCREQHRFHFGPELDPAAARVRAQDRGAMSDLRNALAAALTYFTEGDSFAGFETGVAESVEPSLTWSASGQMPNGEGAVDIALADREHVVLLADSASGAAFCIAYDSTTGGGGAVRGQITGVTPTTWEACEALPDW